MIPTSKWFLHNKTIGGKISALPESESTLLYAKGHILKHIEVKNADEAFKAAEEAQKNNALQRS